MPDRIQINSISVSAIDFNAFSTSGSPHLKLAFQGSLISPKVPVA